MALLALSFATLYAQDVAYEREKMVRDQILARGISDSGIVKAMSRIERHLFLPEKYRERAYWDGAQPIGYGQTIAQPYMIAYMTDALALGPNDTVLEIGTGSGYHTAILAALARTVYTVEIHPILAQRAKALLQSLGYQNILLRTGDGYDGWEGAAPFDRIVVTCAPTHIPMPLQAQLKEGGRMVIPITEGKSQFLYVFEKKQGAFHRVSKLPVRFVPMKDKEGKAY